MKHRGLWAGIAANVIWGFLPIYWKQISNVEPISILANRVIWSAAFSMLLLLCTGRIGEVKTTLKDWKQMRWLMLTAVFITCNWGIYIWAVNSGHVLDASLGYYIDPLMGVALGMAVFHERFGALEIGAIILAVVGVAISTISSGVFPLVALLIASLFSVYGAIIKFVHADAIVSIAIETALMTPLAIAYLLLSTGGQAALQAMDWRTAGFLMGAGPVTAVPLMLYAQGVNDLPLSTMGFLLFLLPTLLMLVGVVVYGEPFTPDKIVVFAFICAALLLYTIGRNLRERKKTLVQ